MARTPATARSGCDAASPWRVPQATDHSERHGVIRGIQRGTAARNASYSFPNVSSSAGSSCTTTTVWNEATLKAYLSDPQAVVKGNKMPYGGLEKAGDVEDVVEYLKGLK